MGVKEGSSGQQDGQQSQQGMGKTGTSPAPSASAATTGAASECSRENRDELFLYLCAWRGESGSGVSVVTQSVCVYVFHAGQLSKQGSKQQVCAVKAGGGGRPGCTRPQVKVS
ncbi:hypothetical protein Pcinc_043177 [Petrolisthes cinctipes]|uniref:Uncharacterized protein n=1 Tax=Petrolisthes cinctipes TaxID=88211 RepID=A0AAE1BGH2_PETCI|nr:hypothetical protein Pcinc_043177 [Petrolisthes cinctipes]